MLEIRRFRETDDIDEVSRIHALSWKKAYRGIIPDDYLDSIPETRWSARLLPKANRIVLAVLDGEIVGVSTYEAARDEAMAGWGEVISLYLLPSHYREGIGTKLFNAVINELVLEGYKNIYLWVLEDNTSARDFYEKNGFTLNGDINADNIGGKAVNEVRYVFNADMQ
jgi:GNAT superfamily N-acetyltransferase